MCGNEKIRPHKMETWTQDLYSLKIALNQLIYTKNLRERERGGGLRACLEKALFPYKTHEYAKKNEPCGSKLALAKKLEILKKNLKVSFSRKTKYFSQCFWFSEITLRCREKSIRMRKILPLCFWFAQIAQSRRAKSIRRNERYRSG